MLQYILIAELLRQPQQPEPPHSYRYTCILSCTLKLSSCMLLWGRSALQMMTHTSPLALCAEKVCSYCCGSCLSMSCFCIWCCTVLMSSPEIYLATRVCKGCTACMCRRSCRNGGSSIVQLTSMSLRLPSIHWCRACPKFFTTRCSIFRTQA